MSFRLTITERLRKLTFLVQSRFIPSWIGVGIGTRTISDWNASVGGEELRESTKFQKWL